MKKTKLLLSIIALTLLVLIVCLLPGVSPLSKDREVVFVREIPAEQLNREHFAHLLGTPSRWPQWHFGVSHAEVVGSGSARAPSSELASGSVVRLTVAPKGLRLQPIFILARVTDYVPGQMISFQLLSDSSGKITRLFDRLSWRIELISKPGQGASLKAQVVGHTASWRSRLFAEVAPKIMMYQVLYADLDRLAGSEKPEAVEFVPQGT